MIETKDPLENAIRETEKLRDELLEQGTYFDSDLEEGGVSDERSISVFFELHQQMSSNIQTLDIKEVCRIRSIVEEIVDYEISLPTEASDYLRQIVNLLQVREKAGVVFKGKEGTA